MSSPRSLFAWRHSNCSSKPRPDNKRNVGRPWSIRSMSTHSPEATSLFFHSQYSPFADMSQTDEQADALLNLPGPQKGHHHALDYAEKVFYRFHKHTTSDCTATSGSNDSSPTTTASTVDDSSATEPSPGSSPESPPPSTFTTGMLRPRTSDDTRSPFFELQKQPPPSRKGRNLKNLAVNTSRNPRASSTTSLPLQPTPAASATASQSIAEANPLASPAFVKPPSPPRRKPSNLGLTLLTPGSSKLPPQEIRLAIPPTPAFGRPGTLRHFQSSPSLPLVPGLASETGIGSHCARRPTPLNTILSPVEQIKQAQIDEEEEQNFDIPLSREEKPEAYPDGPICVYEPNIDLYLEPTAEQCRQYDVVMNVASEVRNPLIRHGDHALEEPDIRIDGGGGIQYAPRRLQASATAEKGLDTRDESPSTPKATPLNNTFPPEIPTDPPRKDPEYIHIPWEHNSDIVPDLLRLSKLIDEKAKQGKRVLVHCQCGVSRSASLVVAYGLYKDPTMSVQEAYDAVKRKSKWIGPNMNLIMQLQEFRTSLTRGGLLPGNRGFTPITPSSAYSEWRGPFSANPTDSIHNNIPLSASMSSTNQAVDTGLVHAVSPGPSSAPSGLKWPISTQASPVQAQRARAASAVKPVSAYVDPSGHVIPVLKVEPDTSDATAKAMHSDPQHDEQDSATPTESLSSPRSAEFAMVSLKRSLEDDPADEYGLMSPTSTEFSSSFFDRSSLLASLGMGSMPAVDGPRRSLSLRSRSKQQSQSNIAASQPLITHQVSQLQPTPRLRGKISSPSLREQKELQNLQSRIEASLPPRAYSTRGVSEPAGPFGAVDEALMSPRATEFTKNPFALALPISDRPETAPKDEVPRHLDTDPRSPAVSGVSPITRNIMDVL